MNKWTIKYPAIDGIAKPDRNHRSHEDCMGNDVTLYDRAEQPIRPDVQYILHQSPEEFGKWYEKRRNAVVTLLMQFGYIASIPDLGNGVDARTFGDRTAIKNMVDLLEEAHDHLRAISDVKIERELK